MAKGKGKRRSEAGRGMARMMERRRVQDGGRLDTRDRAASGDEGRRAFKCRAQM
jgi:hypothetical protein